MSRSVSISVFEREPGQWTWKRHGRGDQPDVTWQGNAFRRRSEAEAHARMEHAGRKIEWVEPVAEAHIWNENKVWLWETASGFGSAKSYGEAERRALASVAQEGFLKLTVNEKPSESAFKRALVSEDQTTTEDRSTDRKSTFSTVSAIEPVRQHLTVAPELLPILHDAVEKARKDLLCRLDPSYTFGRELTDYERVAVDRANQERLEAIDDLIQQIRPC